MGYLAKLCLHFSVYAFILLKFLINGQTNQPGKPLIVLFVPNRQADNYMSTNYDSIFTALVNFAKAIIGKDNIVVLGDSYTILLLEQYLPTDILLETDINYFWLRDFSPIRDTFFTFVRQKREYGSTMEQQKFKDFLALCTRRPYHYESSLISDGGNVVHNDYDKAALTSSVYDQNSYLSTEQILTELRRALRVKKVVVIPKETSGEPSGHIDLVLSFIDYNVIAFSDLTGSGQLQTALRTEFGPLVRLVELYSTALSSPGSRSACGRHVNILSTKKYLYVPVFGKDEANRVRGQSKQRDALNLQIIQGSTQKTVVPIDIPYSICTLGGNARCLSWNIEGPTADDIVYAAQTGGCPANR